MVNFRWELSAIGYIGVEVEPDRVLRARSEAVAESRIAATRGGKLTTGGQRAWIGAPGGTRTHNLLLRRQALYPLSYGGGTAPIIHPARNDLYSRLAGEDLADRLDELVL